MLACLLVSSLFKSCLVSQVVETLLVLLACHFLMADFLFSVSYGVYIPSSEMFLEPLAQRVCCRCIRWGWMLQGHLLSAFRLAVVMDSICCRDMSSFDEEWELQLSVYTRMNISNAVLFWFCDISPLRSMSSLGLGHWLVSQYQIYFPCEYLW